jgi:hypothetical protein
MKRHSAWLGLAVALCSPLFACDKPGVTEQQREDKATQMAELAREQSSEQAENAQASAEKEIAAARNEFEKAREEYRHERYGKLSDLDQKIANLDAEDRTATGKKKSNLDDRLPAIHAQRDAFARGMQSLDHATGTTWDSERASLDKEWDDLVAAVDKAK